MKKAALTIAFALAAMQVSHAAAYTISPAKNNRSTHSFFLVHHGGKEVGYIEAGCQNNYAKVTVYSSRGRLHKHYQSNYNPKTRTTYTNSYVSSSSGKGYYPGSSSYRAEASFIPLFCNEGGTVKPLWEIRQNFGKVSYLFN